MSVGKRVKGASSIFSRVRHDYSNVDNVLLVGFHKTLLKAHAIITDPVILGQLQNTFPDCKALKDLIILVKLLEVVE